MDIYLHVLFHVSHYKKEVKGERRKTGLRCARNSPLFSFSLHATTYSRIEDELAQQSVLFFKNMFPFFLRWLYFSVVGDRRRIQKFRLHYAFVAFSWALTAWATTGYRVQKARARGAPFNIMILSRIIGYFSNHVPISVDKVKRLFLKRERRCIPSEDFNKLRGIWATARVHKWCGGSITGYTLIWDHTRGVRRGYLSCSCHAALGNSSFCQRIIRSVNDERRSRCLLSCLVQHAMSFVKFPCNANEKQVLEPSSGGVPKYRTKTDRFVETCTGIATERSII